MTELGPIKYKNCRMESTLTQENALYTGVQQKLTHFRVFLDIYDRKHMLILSHILAMFVE